MFRKGGGEFVHGAEASQFHAFFGAPSKSGIAGFVPEIINGFVPLRSVIVEPVNKFQIIHFLVVSDEEPDRSQGSKEVGDLDAEDPAHRDNFALKDEHFEFFYIVLGRKLTGILVGS